MLVFQLIVAFVCVISSLSAVEVDMMERDHVMEKFLANAPTAESDEWVSEGDRISILCPHQLSHLRQEGCNANNPILPGYLSFSNYGSDTTCQPVNLQAVHVRRMNECFFGMKYTVGVTANKNYGLNVLYFEDSSCKTPKPSETQTFYFPKNGCVGGMKFFTQVSIPSFSPGNNHYATYTSYKFRDRCENQAEPSKVDAYITGVCFPGDGVDVKFESCPSNHEIALKLYGSTGGQCAGDGNSKTFNSQPPCGREDVYGATTTGFIRQTCVISP